MKNSTPVTFAEVNVGDTLIFCNRNTGFGADGTDIERTGTVTTKTDKTITVQVHNPAQVEVFEQGKARTYGLTARLRAAAWYDRQVRRVVAEQPAEKTPVEGRVIAHQDATCGTDPEHANNPAARAAITTLTNAGFTPVTVNGEFDPTPGDGTTGFYVEVRYADTPDEVVYVHDVLDGKLTWRRDADSKLSDYAKALADAGWSIPTGTARVVRALPPIEPAPAPLPKRTPEQDLQDRALEHARRHGVHLGMHTTVHLNGRTVTGRIRKFYMTSGAGRGEEYRLPMAHVRDETTGRDAHVLITEVPPPPAHDHPATNEEQPGERAAFRTALLNRALQLPTPAPLPKRTPGTRIQDAINTARTPAPHRVSGGSHSTPTGMRYVGVCLDCPHRTAHAHTADRMDALIAEHRAATAR